MAQAILSFNMFSKKATQGKLHHNTTRRFVEFKWSVSNFIELANLSSWLLKLTVHEYVPSYNWQAGLLFSNWAHLMFQVLPNKVTRKDEEEKEAAKAEETKAITQVDELSRRRI